MRRNDLEVFISSKHEEFSRKCQTVGWKSKLFDEELFILSLEDKIINSQNIYDNIKEVIKTIITACDVAMPRNKIISKFRKSTYWWTKEISELRKKCNKARRQYQRARNNENSNNLETQYKNLRRELKIEIKSSKYKCWINLCNEVNNDVWGRPYQIIMKKFKPFKNLCPTCPKLLYKIVNELFPKQREIIYNLNENNNESIPEITPEELTLSLSTIKNKKTPGLDKFPNIAIKSALKARPDIFINLYNKCLKEGIFPIQWKKQKLVLIPKGQKPPNEASSYRPICLLNTLGKIFEKIISNRLINFIDSNNGLSINQFGFRRNKSTIDAVKYVVDIAKQVIAGKRWKRGSKKYYTIVSLDIKNAFNSAKWECIHEALLKLQVPNYIRRILKNYLKDRILVYDTEDGQKEYKITGGIPQGSVLGPLLWNIMYDNIFKLSLPKECKIVGYADDVALIIVSKLKEEIIQLCNESITIIRNWLMKVGLRLAENKTEAILISSRKIRESITIKVGNEKIRSKEFIKYLGIIIDDKLSFKSHLQYTKITGKNNAE